MRQETRSTGAAVFGNLRRSSADPSKLAPGWWADTAQVAEDRAGSRNGGQDPPWDTEAEEDGASGFDPLAGRLISRNPNIF
jgi:hypothetical protein